MTIDISLRELPFLVIGAGATALPAWTEVPPAAVLPLAVLIAVQIRVRRRA
ncbi:hypothetical protein [Streptomyces sp. NBC_00091]|uniref:hypothetical protein n=1 Tax=Streptomyces sp. NBC_00091 TaxID=2975648 RepID=UPI002254FD8B|nr:hypothetical protein [Streptomyces sp. NBC_00091]MCX5376917.1 hypothetical protein [Streptomyces sp. NBC_00091]